MSIVVNFFLPLEDPLWAFKDVTAPPSLGSPESVCWGPVGDGVLRMQPGHCQHHGQSPERKLLAGIPGPHQRGGGGILRS
jgi:hypothetical protein